MYHTRIEQYKGNDVFKILKVEDGEEKFLVSFGKRKAQAICANIQEIATFAGNEELLKKLHGDGAPF